MAASLALRAIFGANSGVNGGVAFADEDALFIVSGTQVTRQGLTAVSRRVKVCGVGCTEAGQAQQEVPALTSAAIARQGSFISALATSTSRQYIAVAESLATRLVDGACASLDASLRDVNHGKDFIVNDNGKQNGTGNASIILGQAPARRNGGDGPEPQASRRADAAANDVSAALIPPTLTGLIASEPQLLQCELRPEAVVAVYSTEPVARRQVLRLPTELQWPCAAVVSLSQRTDAQNPLGVINPLWPNITCVAISQDDALVLVVYSRPATGGVTATRGAATPASAEQPARTRHEATSSGVKAAVSAQRHVAAMAEGASSTCAEEIEAREYMLAVFAVEDGHLMTAVRLVLNYNEATPEPAAPLSLQAENALIMQPSHSQLHSEIDTSRAVQPSRALDAECTMEAGPTSVDASERVTAFEAQSKLRVSALEVSTGSRDTGAFGGAPTGIATVEAPLTPSSFLVENIDAERLVHEPLTSISESPLQSNSDGTAAVCAAVLLATPVVECSAAHEASPGFTVRGASFAPSTVSTRVISQHVIGIWGRGCLLMCTLTPHKFQSQLAEQRVDNYGAIVTIEPEVWSKPPTLLLQALQQCTAGGTQADYITLAWVPQATAVANSLDSGAAASGPRADPIHAEAIIGTARGELLINLVHSRVESVRRMLRRMTFR